MSAEPVLHIELFDRFSVRYGDDPVTAVNTVRLQSLLAYLLLHCRQGRRREELAFLFWPDSTDAQARTNLRRELHNLRQALPEADHFLETSSQTLRWRSDAPFALDVDRFERALERVGQDKAKAETNEETNLEFLEKAVSLYRGDLLSNLYDAWLEPERERLRLACKRALEELTDRLEAKREYKVALRHARKLLLLEPLDETSHRTVIRLHALSGDRAGALHSYHKCVDLLQDELGAEPSPATQELYERLLGEEIRPPERRSLTPAAPLVGRQGEWRELLRVWRKAAGEKAQFVAISGEAGIGKTRLAEELLAWAQQQGVTVARTRSYAAEGRLPFAPLQEILHTDGFKTARLNLEPVWLAELARLLPELLVEHPDLPRPEALGEGWQRGRFFEALARAALSPPQPLVLLFDDLQWCDPDTLEWLHYLLRSAPFSKFLVVGTIRSEEQGDNLALSTLLLDLQNLEHLTSFELGPLNPTETALLSAHISGHSLDEVQTAQLFATTEGHPLFVVETAHAGLLDAGREERRRQTVADPTIPNRRSLPPKVWAIVATRLAQLSPGARDLVGLAATVGRAFSLDMLHQAGDLDEEKLVQSLDELWHRRIIREQSLGTYDFTHDRIREFAYTQLSPIRRRLLHRRVARALELLHAPNLGSVSAPLAAHYEQAGQTAKAVGYYRQAAAAAALVSAYEEVRRLLSRALTLLGRLPVDQGRDRQELDLQLTLLASLSALDGYTSAALNSALERVYTLGKELGDESAVIQGLWGLLASNLVRGNIQVATQFGKEALIVAKNDSVLLSDAHNSFGGACVIQGWLAVARDHYEKAIVLYNLNPGRWLAFGADSRVFSLCFGSHGLCLQGDLDTALANAVQATTLADELEHPYTRVLAHAYRALLHTFRHEVDAAAVCAEIVLQEANKYSIVYYREWGVIVSGWIRVKRGSPEEGVKQIRSGLENLQAQGAHLRRPYYLSLLAEAHLALGQPETARPLLDAAISTATQNLDVWWLAELHRLRGELLEGIHAEAEFKQALEIAQGQGNKLLELRSAVSLAQLWLNQDKGQEAHSLLSEVYGWFTEGFDTQDLQKARALLGALS